ncbi:serine proteinase inhibitor [Moumouvirus australiensis]|uniref:Serine proteinase inhibitor n=1 Tax=Moumouvirus australiensis TaxID=2109587 RepID=A0A2P1EL26_9VIRU|nr:serine proteinase inhibitor [Moumouvirus australiensis]AVL94588.1 serine proteinase inhibitor [Moumouvirus australiensis]
MDYQKKYLKYKKKYTMLKQKLDLENNIFGGKVTEFDSKISDANHQFTINTFNNFDTASNIFSPLSLNYTLSLLHLGALDKTNNELVKLLKYKYSLDDLDYIKNIFNDESIKMSNLFIINDKYKINKEYIDLVNNLAKFIFENFTDSDIISNKVNNFIEQKTNGLIKNVITPSDIKKDMILVLVNTIYFKSKWSKPFKINKTIRDKFYGENKFVDYMRKKDYYQYYENNSYQIVEIPYKNDNYVFGIILPILPVNNDNVDYTINNVPILSTQEIDELINNLQLQKVDLKIPKFTQKKRLEFVPILQKMGLSQIFKQNAQLDIISQEIFISRIIHEAVIIVDENGTKASATTIVSGLATMSMPIKENIKTFKADHPFVFYIRHIPTNMFLFYGDFQG